MSRQTFQTLRNMNRIFKSTVSQGKKYFGLTAMIFTLIMIQNIPYAYLGELLTATIVIGGVLIYSRISKN